MENMKNEVVYVDEVTGEAVVFDKADGRTFTGVYLKRERVPSQKLKKMLWIYYAEGEIKGKKVKANFAPQSKDDVMTFTNLDIIFDGDMAPIYAEKSSYKNKDGQMITRTVYKVITTDEFDEEFSATVIPQKDSDKAIFDYFCRRAKKLAEQEAEKAAQTAEDPGDVTPETPPVEKPEKKNKS